MLTRTRRTQAGTTRRTPASCRRSATSRRPTSRGPRTARRCGGRSTRSAASSAGITRCSIGGAGGRHRPATARLARPRPQLAGRRRDVAWPTPSTPSEPSPRPGRHSAGLGGDTGRATAPRSWSARPRSCGRAGSSWPPGRSTSAASPGRGRRRRRRGDRLLRVLRPRDDPPGRAAASRRPRRDQRHRAPAARRGRGHPALELPAGDPHRHDRRGAGGGQRRDPQAGRAVAGDGLAPGARSSARPACRRAC